MTQGMKTITEPPRDVPVYYEADVAVVGGGPAGLTSAIAAARHGSKVVLIERYGYVGGMATGGLVILLDSMSNDRGEHVIRGIAQEIVEHLVEMNGVVYPPKDTWGSSDPELVNTWRQWGAVTGNHVRYSPTIHPEYFKFIGNRLLDDAQVKTLFHSWVCSTIVEKDAVKGVVLESKSGRLAVLSKITIDCTGDGDVFAMAGAPYEKGIFPMGVIFRVGGVDTKKVETYARQHPEEMKSLLQELVRMGGIKGGIVEQSIGSSASYTRTTIESIVWFNNSFPKVDSLNIGDLTHAEKEIRKQMMVTVKFFHDRVPGFENSYLIDTAPQIGTRASRRLIGEHVLTREEMLAGKEFEDVITTCASGVDGRPLINIPYRSLLPQKVENLLVAGRCISCDFATQTIVRIIPSCMAMGQAAGTAAALAVKMDVSPRKVDPSELQSNLLKDGMYLRMKK